MTPHGEIDTASSVTVIATGYLIGALVSTSDNQVSAGERRPQQRPRKRVLTLMSLSSFRQHDFVSCLDQVVVVKRESVSYSIPQLLLHMLQREGLA